MVPVFFHGCLQKNLNTVSNPPYHTTHISTTTNILYPLPPCRGQVGVTDFYPYLSPYMPEKPLYLWFPFLFLFLPNKMPEIKPSSLFFIVNARFEDSN